MTSPQKSKRKRTQSPRKIEARAGMKLLKTEAAKLVQEWESDVGGQMAFVGISPSGKLFKIGHVDKLMDKFLCENQSSSSEPTQNNLPVPVRVPVPVPVREQGPSNQQISRDPEEIKADEEEIKKYREELIQKKAELIKNMGDFSSDSEDDVGVSLSDSESESNSE